MIKYYVKTVYGKDRLYLADQKKKELWQVLTKNKTITPEQVRAFKILSEDKVEFRQVPVPNKEEL